MQREKYLPKSNDDNSKVRRISHWFSLSPRFAHIIPHKLNSSSSSSFDKNHNNNNNSKKEPSKWYCLCSAFYTAFTNHCIASHIWTWINEFSCFRKLFCVFQFERLAMKATTAQPIHGFFFSSSPSSPFGIHSLEMGVGIFYAKLEVNRQNQTKRNERNEQNFRAFAPTLKDR